MLAFLTTALFLVAVLVGGCSDDPILGPNDESEDDSGGSYSTIERLAPTDSSAAPSPPSQPQNPERF